MALGYAMGKKIFYAPYETSSFYDQGGLCDVFNELRKENCLVILPCGSDRVLRYIADECIVLDSIVEKIWVYHKEKGMI